MAIVGNSRNVSTPRSAKLDCTAVSEGHMPLHTLHSHSTHPGLHVSEEVLKLGEPDLGGGHELLHDGQVSVARAEGLATIELNFPPTFLHASPQLSHVLLKFFHAEIGHICKK